MAKTQKILISFLVLFVFLFDYHFSFAQSANFYFSPSSNSFSIGQTFSVTVYVNTNQQAINAISGIINFPADKLQVTSLSKSGSIVSMWIPQEPSFNNTAGTINFEGVIVNPGYTGSNGKILTISFKTKSAGTASLMFSSGAILANDGVGTNITGKSETAQFVIKATSATEPGAGEAVTPVSKSGTPQAIKIESSTHPNSQNWYQNDSPKLTWNLSDDITKIAYALDQNQTTVPNTAAEQLVTSYQAQNLKEGIWYFHLQAKNALGWGSVSHFKIQIDKTPPESFTIIVDNQGDPTNPQPYLSFTTKDALSGINYYEIQIDQLPIIKVTPQEIQNGKYQIPVTPPDSYQVLIKAIDNANNFTIATGDLIIEPLKSPVISDYSKQVQINEPITLKGTADKAGVIEISVINEAKEIFKEKINTENDGSWQYVSSKSFKKGVYLVSAILIDKRGAMSNPSEAVRITVNAPLFIQIGNLLINYLSVINTLIALVILLILIILYGLRKIRILQKSKISTVTEDEKALYQVFIGLRKDLTNQISNLEGQTYLSDKEAQILDELKKSLDNAEKSIAKIIRRKAKVDNEA